MHADPKRRGGFRSNRIRLTIALGLAAAAIGAALVLGHHPAAEGASKTAAEPPAAAMTSARAGDFAGDPSVPAASDAIGRAPADAGPVAETF